MKDRTGKEKQCKDGYFDQIQSLVSINVITGLYWQKNVCWKVISALAFLIFLCETYIG